MKKFFYSVLSLMLCILFVCPMTAYAGEVGGVAVSNPPEWYDIELTEDEINEILSKNDNNSPVPYSNILINSYKLAISGSGSTLNLVAKTVGNVNVVKAGFTRITIQQRKNSSYSWSNYVSYYDLYSDSTSYTLTKAIPVTRGYQYRATCVHYAKKSLLKTEKINNTSNIVTIP